MATYGDTNYTHHAAAAQIAGVIAMRLANADVLPFRYSQYATSVSENLDRLSNLQVQLYDQQMVSFDREMEQAQAWHDAAENLEGKVDALIAANASVSPKLANEFAFINQKLIGQERDLTQAKGLPGQPVVQAHDLLHRHPLRLQCGDPAGARGYDHGWRLGEGSQLCCAAAQLADDCHSGGVDGRRSRPIHCFPKVTLQRLLQDVFGAVGPPQV